MKSTPPSSNSYLEFLDGSSKEEIRRFKIHRAELWSKTDRVERKNNILKKQNEILKAKYKKTYQVNLPQKSETIAQLKKEQRYPDVHEMLLSSQTNKLKDMNQIAGEKNLALEKKLREPEKDIKRALTIKTVNNVSSLKIKVLSGDGNIKSAQRMTKKLKKMGYRVKRIDLAPRSNFRYNTVYAATGFQNAANRMESNFDGKLVIKPLNWHSVFDLIVVTAKNQ